MTPPMTNLRRIAYVVANLDEALDHWTRVMKAGPFYRLDHAPLANKRYRGQDSDVDISLAIGYSGDLQIELIQQNNEAPSVYKEFLDAGRTGIHHIGIMPEDYQAALAPYGGLGHGPAFEADFGGAKLTDIDTVVRTSNPIESTFATVRHRTKRTKGCLSRKTGLAMAFKLVMSAQGKWRKLDCRNRLPEIIEGVEFRDGLRRVQIAA